MPDNLRIKLMLEKDLLISSGYTEEMINDMEEEEYSFIIQVKYLEKFKKVKQAERSPFANL